MKARHSRFYRTDAIATLQMCRVSVGQDFHTLSSTSVECLLSEADRVGYRRPRNANGSRGRYFHDMLQRRAKGTA